MREGEVLCCGLVFWVYLIIVSALVLLAGILSGLALGLLSFSQVDLQVLVTSGKPQDKKNAAKILPVVKNEHLLLCTLLVGKSLAMMALPILLDSILTPWGAIIVSTILVVAFSEIIPQAVCSRYGLSLGAKMSTLVRFFMFVLFPISYPISKILDCVLGEGRSVLLRRAELKTLVDLHEAGKGGELSHHETSIITGALDLTQKSAKDAMTPISRTFSLDINSKLDMYTMGLVMSKGHSRIPIYSGNPANIIGLILAKNLIFCRPEDESPVRNLTIRRIPRVHQNWPLYDILNLFQKGHSHMAVVIKSEKDVKDSSNNLTSNSSVLETRINLDTKQMLAERTGHDSPGDSKMHLRITRNSSHLHSRNNETQTPTLMQVMEQDKDFLPQSRQRENDNEIISFEDVETLPSNLNEEAIGIITMEDVMEALLQEQILDETDEYVDVHNKIRINLLPSRRPLSRSSSRVSDSRIHWRTAEPSPFSSFRSPSNLYVQAAFIGQTLNTSPGRSMPNSPATTSGHFHSSASSPRVPRDV